MKSRTRYLHLAILTEERPTSNNRTKNELSQAQLQVATVGEQSYAMISSVAFKNGLRTCLEEDGWPCNRSRVDETEKGPTVSYQGYLDASKWADDFLCGGTVAKTEDIAAHPGMPSKIHATVLANQAMSVRPLTGEHMLQQSPFIVGVKGGTPPFQNDTKGALIGVPFHVSSYAIPVSFCLNKVTNGLQATWMRAAIKVLGDLANCAGNHARWWFTMEPKSFVARLTDRRTSQLNLYGWTPEGKFLDIDRLLPFGQEKDLDAKEFVLAGDLVRKMSDERQASLKKEGVKLYRDVQTALNEIAEIVLPEEK